MSNSWVSCFFDSRCSRLWAFCHSLGGSVKLQAAPRHFWLVGLVIKQYRYASRLSQTGACCRSWQDGSFRFWYLYCSHFIHAHRSPYRRLYRRFCFGDVIFTARRYMLARYMLWPCVRLCLFATKTAKRRNTQRKPDDSRGPVVVREYTHAYAVYTAGVSERTPLFARSGSHHPRSILNRIGHVLWQGCAIERFVYLWT